MGKPHTDVLASPQKNSEKLSSIPSRLITVTRANIRNATVSGTFMLFEEHYSTPYTYRGNTVIDVDCSWYQWRPQRRCVRLILRNGETPFSATNHPIAYYTNIER